MFGITIGDVAYTAALGSILTFCGYLGWLAREYFDSINANGADND